MIELRAAGLVCDMDLAGRSVKAQLKMADREKAAVCLIVGEDELKAGEVVVKDMKTSQQAKVALASIASHLKSGG
jgi:histidyl-tRNA synthetase